MTAIQWIIFGWNAFNPFRELSETYDINALDELQPIDVIYATPDDG